jgi:hypothetical protein
VYSLGGWLSKRRVARAVALVALFCGLRVLLALTLHDITPVRVTASGSLDARFPPERVIDHSTVEALTLHDYWLLPNELDGWLRLELDGEYRLDRLQILNTRNGKHSDRATDRYSVELLGASGSSFFTDHLPAYPAWHDQAFPGTLVHAVIIHVEGYQGHGGGLDEVALTGRPASGLAAHRDDLLALLGCGLLGALLLRWPVRWRVAITSERICLVVLALSLVIVGQRLLRFSSAVSSLEWGLVFDIRELDTLAKVKTFFANLVIPIPPLLALLEVASQQLTGNNDFVIKTLYKGSIVGSYLAALWLSYPSIPRMLTTFSVSLLFMVSTVLMHRDNPQLYDPVFPFLVLIFLVLLSAASAVGQQAARRSRGWWAAAGLCLSVVGLTRPFAILLVFGAVIFVACSLPRPRRHLLPFVLGACLLCVPWHAYLYVRHGQFTISNHTGFNLEHAWPMVPLPALVSEDISPPNRPFNNPQHLINSRRIQAAVLRYAVENPGLALRNIAQRVEIMTQARTALDSSLDPKPRVLSVYQMVARVLSWLLLVGLTLRLVAWGRVRCSWFRAAGGQPPRPAPYDPVSGLLLGLTAATLVLLAVGDAGEEYRFMISLLPLLAAVPSLTLNYQRRSVRSPSRAASR